MAMTPSPVHLESMIASLTTEQMADIGASLVRRASNRRELISQDQARQAFISLVLTPGWNSSRLSDLGRVRLATANLVQRGWLPEQIVEPMCVIAAGVSPHPLVAIEAVLRGIEDGDQCR